MDLLGYEILTIGISKPCQGGILLGLIFGGDIFAMWLIGMVAPARFTHHQRSRGWFFLASGILVLLTATAAIGPALHLIAGF